MPGCGLYESHPRMLPADADFVMFRCSLFHWDDFVAAGTTLRSAG
jgi:hypothetical protein